jgi:hypothetical protein
MAPKGAGGGTGACTGAATLPGPLIALAGESRGDAGRHLAVATAFDGNGRDAHGPEHAQQGWKINRCRLFACRLGCRVHGRQINHHRVVFKKIRNIAKARLQLLGQQHQVGRLEQQRHQGQVGTFDLESSRRNGGAGRRCCCHG